MGVVIKKILLQRIVGQYRFRLILNLNDKSYIHIAGEKCTAKVKCLLLFNKCRMHVESSLPETVVIEVLTFYKNF